MKQCPGFWFVLLLFFLVTGEAHPQNTHFQEFGIRDGLASSKVYGLESDDQGRIWLGTVNGVSRFNGYRFENFTTSDGLAPDGVRTVFKDASGAMWFGHYEGGITRYRDGQFEEIHLPDLKSQGDIYEFYEPNPGELWIASNGLGAIHLYDTGSGNGKWRYKQFMGAQGLGDRVFDMARTTDNSLYFITDVGIKKLENDSTFSFYKPGGMTNLFQLTCMLEDSRGMQWFGTHNGGLYKYAPGNSDIEIFDVLGGLAHNFVFCLHEDHEGNIWAGTYGGGISVIGPNGDIQTYNSSNGLPDEKIQCLDSDRENNILIGTNDNGLLISKSFQFNHYPLPDEIGAKRFNALIQSQKGKMYIGTEKGLIETDEKWNSIESYSQADGLTDPNVNAMAFDQYGLLWVGTEFGGLFSFLPSMGKFRSHFFLNQYINQHKVTDLCVGEDNKLWVGTLDGLLAIDENRDNLERISQRDGLLSNHISAVYPARDGDILVGLVGRGVAKVTKDTVLTLLQNGTPSCFLEDEHGTVWVGMEGQGVYLLDENNVTLHLTSDDGLLSNAIATINEGERGSVWIGTNLGLSKFNKENLDVTNYGLSAGFGGVEVKKQSSLKTDKGLWYGTSNGIYLNKPANEKEACEPGEIIFTEILLDDQRIDTSGTIDLNFNQNELAFSYLTVSLSDPENVSYQTYLEGRDAQWSDWTPNRTVKYASLPAGEYKFFVRVRNMWGKEKTATAPVDFIIHPPWYRSTSFYIIAIVAAVFLLIGFIKLRERNLKREKRILAEKVLQRTQEVVEKSEELEKKNNDILDSINYARRIQEAILIPETEIASYGLETFIMYRPKDIVSGDFYWFNRIDDKVLFAAADCTGHGVPGAFMSVVGYSLLDKIAVELKETRPEVILQNLSSGVEKFLRQKENEKMPKDGMDMALVVYDQSTKTLDYSGAFNPLYIVRNGNLEEFKADRFSIGSYQLGGDKTFKRYTTHVEAGDCAYTFSDGFVDQFGGPNYKKFKSRQFKTLLAEISSLPMKEQHAILNETLSNWMGDVEQLDDILVIGVRF